MLGWISRHSSRGDKSKIARGPKIENLRVRETEQNVPNGKHDANSMRPSLLAQEEESQSTRGILSRRDIDHHKRDVLTLQPKVRPSEMPFMDPDFFNNNTTNATAVMLEDFSTATPGGSLSGSLTVEQATAMLAELSHGRDEGEGTPVVVCDSTYEMMVTSEASFGAKTRGSCSGDLCKPSRENISRPEGLSESGSVMAMKRSPDRKNSYSMASASEILRLEDLSKISLDKITPVIRLTPSMAPIRGVSYSDDGPVDGTRMEQFLTTKSESGTIGGTPSATSPKYSQFHEVETSDGGSAQAEENEDAFLYLAWTCMPAQARSSRPQRQRRKGLKPCEMPLPHPKIVAAEARIRAFKSSPKAQQLAEDYQTVSTQENAAEDAPDDFISARGRTAEISATAEFRAFLNDLVFVKMYGEEMKARCSRGVWWEGWVIIEDLRSRGVAIQDV